MATKRLGKEECIEIGGHCYVESREVIMTDPPIFTRVCKHCGHEQEGTCQSNRFWRDIDAHTED